MMSEFDDAVHVLVVDDHRDEAEALAAVLESDGYTVRIAMSGYEALAAIADFPPHCVILDINMPGLDGDGLSSILRRDHGDDVVLIAITGAGKDEGAVVRTYERVDHYLHKPLDVEALRRALPPL